MPHARRDTQSAPLTRAISQDALGGGTPLRSLLPAGAWPTRRQSPTTWSAQWAAFADSPPGHLPAFVSTESLTIAAAQVKDRLRMEGAEACRS